MFYRDVPLGGDLPTTGDGDEGDDSMLSGLLEVRDVLGVAMHTGQHEWRLKDTPQTGSLGPTKTGTPVPPLQQALEVEPIGFIGIFFRFGGSVFLSSLHC